ncbi:MAG: ABC transporter substrate-binding protein [Bifidobacteriaceae bacterium]|jgi:peptide/nickel transport system substrate-binding protein|nr:ABC transporter substrate-binding protein [Bifidobacteriaceae bacterium]
MAALAVAAAWLGLAGGCANHSDRLPPPAGALRAGLTGLTEMDGADPPLATTAGGYLIARQLFDTLTEFGPDGAWQTSLAESVVSNGAATDWTVRLRAATWHNGRPVTADDLVWTVRRWFAEDLAPAALLRAVDPRAVVRVDPTTAVFHLTGPMVDFPEAMASPLMSILPEGFDALRPVGSGPFTLTRNQPGRRISFAANRDYWGEGPHVGTLEIRGYPDGAAELAALDAGDIDLAADIDPADVGRAKASGWSIYAYPTCATLAWAMNTKIPPFDNPAARLALRLAVDREWLAEEVYSGLARLGNDLFAPFDPLYNSALPQRGRDPERAKAMLRAAGLALPVPVTLAGTDNHPAAQRQNAALAEQAAAAGFAVQIRPLTISAFYGEGYGRLSLSLMYWASADLFQQAAATTVTGAPFNTTGWSNPDYDALFADAVASVNVSHRTAVAARMQAIEHASGAFVVPVFPDAVMAHSPRVSGFAPAPNSDGPIGYAFSRLELRP